MLLVIFFQDRCDYVVQLCIYYMSSLEKYEKNDYAPTLCYIYYWGAGLNLVHTTPKLHNWFPSLSNIFVCPPPMLTVTRCIVRSLLRAIKHICASPKLTRAMVTHIHTLAFSRFSLAHRFSFSHWQDVEKRMLQHQSQWTVQWSVSGGIILCFIALIT